MGDGDPLNLLAWTPNQGRYSPLWDVHPAVWVDGITPVRLDHHRDVARAFEEGELTSGGQGPRNPELGGLRAAGFIVNCPVMSLR